MDFYGSSFTAPPNPPRFTPDRRPPHLRWAPAGRAFSKAPRVIALGPSRSPSFWKNSAGSEENRGGSDILELPIGRPRVHKPPSHSWRSSTITVRRKHIFFRSQFPSTRSPINFARPRPLQL